VSYSSHSRVDIPTYKTCLSLLLVLITGPDKMVVCTVVLVAFFLVFLLTGTRSFVHPPFLTLGGPSASWSSHLHSYIFLVSGDTRSRLTYCPSGPMTCDLVCFLPSQQSLGLPERDDTALVARRMGSHRNVGEEIPAQQD
jgi:hypothetical protein